MLTPNLDYVLLFVKDPTISAEFYRKILGLKPIEQSPTFALFALPNNLKLGLWSSKTAEPKVTAQPGAAEITFSNDNIDELYQHWLDLGIPIAQKPTDTDFGRTFVVLDPDGHRIRIHKMIKRS